MFSAILAIMLLPITDLGRSKGFQFRPLSKGAFGGFIVIFFILMGFGGCHVEDPYILLGQISTGLYFGYFVFIMPLVSIIENTLVEFKPKPAILVTASLHAAVLETIAVYYFGGCAVIVGVAVVRACLGVDL